MTKEKKRQHVIPRSYLKAWCDPSTPSGHSPSIWRIPKAGQPYRRSPEKSFVSNDRYTIRLENGLRDLTVEDTLANLENRFSTLLQQIRRGQELAFRQRVDLCLFVSAMQSRSIRAGDSFSASQAQIHEQILNLEKQHDLDSFASDEIRRLQSSAFPDLIMHALDIQTPLYLGMYYSILVTNNQYGFITSDTPSVWHNPQGYKLPPFYRSPGLAQEDVEVTMPLTPQHMLLFRHKPMPAYQNISDEVLLVANARTLTRADKEVVSWKGFIDPAWSQAVELPDDAWENTGAGKSSIKRRDEWEALRRDWETKTK